MMPMHSSNNGSRFGVAAAFVAATVASCGSHDDDLAVVSQFCEEIAIGTLYEVVRERAQQAKLQTGGTAPRRDHGTEEKKAEVTGMLLERMGSPSDKRPVCAVYYSDPFKGGDGKVIHKEFMPAWERRY